MPSLEPIRDKPKAPARLLASAAILFALASPLAAQEEAPTPPPRPDHLGSAPASEFDEEPAVARPSLPLTTDPQPVSLSARAGENGPFIPDGLVWRIFDTRTDETGELALLAKSEEATAIVELPPGRYISHVAYGRAQASDTLDVEPGPNTRTIILEVGGLELNAVISGDVAIPAELLAFDISTEAPGGNLVIAENVPPGEMMHLNAGIYSVVSRFGPANAVVRTELRVEPGQLTEATLYHHAAEVSLKLVSEQGGEAIADVDWTIETASGERVFTDIGAFPETVLAEGSYRVRARLGENLYQNEFEVSPGEPLEIEILTSS